MQYKVTLAAVLVSLPYWFQPLPAQEPSPVIYLTADEAVKVKKVFTDYKNANDRMIQAADAWTRFHQTYQVLHPELPNVRFTSDCRKAFTLRNSSLTSWMEASAVDLSAEDRKKLEGLLREKEDSERDGKQAFGGWRDYQHQFVADHVPSTGIGSMLKMQDGSTYVISNTWIGGVAFTPDFQMAVPARR